MPETFLILLCGGVMLAAAISDPWAVILRWLRLAGMIALTMAGLAGFFVWRQDVFPESAAILLGMTIVAILCQLAFVQAAWRRTQRVFATVAVAGAIVTGTLLLWQILSPRVVEPNVLLIGVACGLAAACAGLSLMDMLLGHAYLNAAQMTMAPFMRLNRSLAWAMIVRAGLSIIGTLVIQWLRPMEMFWNLFALYIGTRWLVGLIVPGVFVWMARDCISRRATQSATGILYVAGVLVFIGEMIGLYLISETGMPL